MAFEEYARVELRKVHFECSKHGFTLHGIRHAESVEEKLGRLVPHRLLVSEYDPKDHADALAPEELLILLLATWSHDFGMIDPEQRHIHNCLSRDYIWDSEKKESRVLWCSLESNFAFYVSQLCYAHRDHRSADGTRVDTLSAIKDLTFLGMKGNRVRPRLLAALLRLADELDVGFYRAPEDVMQVVNLSEESAGHWVGNQLINSVDIDSVKLRVSLIPFEAKVKGNPLYEQLVDARCLKIQEELERMQLVLRNTPFDYREVQLGEEPIHRIMMRNLLSYQGHSIETYKDAVREMAQQVDEYGERFENLGHIAEKLEEVAESCRRLAVRPVLHSGPPDTTGVARALLVVDNSGWRGDLEKGLRPYFAEVVQANSVSQAIEKINERSFTVIVTELNLDTPRAGFDVLKAARQASRRWGLHTQVVILARRIPALQGQPGISAEAIMQGAYDCLEYTSHSTGFTEEVQDKVREAISFQAGKARGGIN
jgi:CheY-like chemotaxis protein